MESRRGQADQHVAHGDLCAVDDSFTIDDANDKPGDVVFAVGIEARHFRGLPTKQRAAIFATTSGHTGYDLFGNVWREPASREVVEKEQRPRALHEDVIHAVIHQIGADRIVAVAEERHLQLRADAVGAGYEHRFAKALTIELEQTPK